MQLNTIKSLRDTVRAWRAGGETIALVPTMGALHVGHLALVAAAKVEAKRVVVSIFVNPTQFGPNEDFSRYPRQLEQDLALLREAGADAAWLPTVEEMYPQGFGTVVHVEGPSAGLDGDFRPGHFDGVATVVSKLLLQVAPDVALFGQKDYQQLAVITRMAADLDMDTRILGVPTVREEDGLALSSRNAYLTEEERAIAPQLHVVLQVAANELQGGSEVATTLKKAINTLLHIGFKSVDYLELRSDTLEPMSEFRAPARLLVAAHLGKTRLIDNLEVE